MGRRGDAANLPFAARQLEYVFTEVVTQPYPALAFADQANALKAVAMGAYDFQGKQIWIRHYTPWGALPVQQAARAHPGGRCRDA